MSSDDQSTRTPESVPQDARSARSDVPTISPRDLAIVRHVSTFKLSTSTIINELHFSELHSKTPCDRALRRLVEGQWLIRIERRLAGGSRGGSGTYVYGLGRRGFYAHHTGRFTPIRSVQHHTLAITGLYVDLKRLERAGHLSITGYSTEPHSWAQIGDTELKPDMYTQLLRPSGKHIRAWWEVDMGTEGQKQVRAKLDAVWRAFEQATPEEWPTFPVTVWAVIDAEREAELRWLISQMPEQAQALFRVCRLDTVASVLGIQA